MVQLHSNLNRKKDGIDYLESGLDNMSITLSNFFGFLKDTFINIYNLIEDFYYWARGEEHA